MTSTLLPGNIVYGGPLVNYETKAYKSLGHYILEKYKSYGDKVVLINASTGTEYSGSYIYKTIIKLAFALRGLGIRQNDVIGLISENSFEFAITMFATFANNATVAPMNITYSERELHHAVNLSKPKVIFASNISIDKVINVAKKNSFIQHVILLDKSNDMKIIKIKKKQQLLTFHDLIVENATSTLPTDWEYLPANKNDDIALIVCSSGTTGLPKGVQITQNNVLYSLDSQNDPTGIPLSEINILTVIPWFHSFGCVSLIFCACVGTCLIFLPKFEERIFLQSIQKYRIVSAFMVPPLMVFLAKHPMVSEYDLSSLILLLCGAAPLSQETEDQIKKRIGVPIIRQGYGLSESTLSVTVQTDMACKPGSVGVLKVGLYAKVIDPDTGNALGPNQRGELCFKGDAIMKGYIGDTKSTQSAIIDGWLHTGDIGYFDDDFEFFIVDRIKELIKYKGYQVPPAEIESLLLTHPKIKDAAVIGKPDEESGELPMAFVAKQLNVALSEKDVIDFVAEHASPAKRLRGGVVFVNEIPKNASGKILRRVLRDMLKSKIQKKSKL